MYAGRKDNTMTTKEQERKALEKIKKIVAELGENSYIGTAFQGCFEDAETNIENDFAFSMKDRVDTANRVIEALQNTERELRAAIKKEHERAESFREWAESAEARYNELKKRQLSFDDLDDFAAMLNDSMYECEKNIEHAAETIVAMADTPTDIAFQNAVNIHRRYQKKLQYTKDLLARVKLAKEGTANE